LPLAGAALGTIIAVISMIPPMAILPILPILFIVFGLGELSKVVLIVIGVAPFLIRDQALAVASLPREQMIKAQTLGASTWHVAIRVVLPQIMPRLIESVRLSLGPAFLFLIFGRGHRIRRRPRLPHLPGAALSGHGRHHSLRRVDHAAVLHH
jgi:NitT/TauT family transport system permease protein